MPITAYTLTIEVAMLTGEDFADVPIVISLNDERLYNGGTPTETVLPHTIDRTSNALGIATTQLIPSSIVGTYHIQIGEYDRLFNMPAANSRLSALPGVDEADVVPASMDIRLANLVADLSTAEQTIIKQKLDIDESGGTGTTVTGLSLTGTTLTLTDSQSNTVSVNLATLRTINTNTFLESASFTNNVLTLTLSDSTSITVDLSDLEDTLMDTNTTVSSLALATNGTLTLTDSAGGTVTVDLSGLDTDTTNASAALASDGTLTITDSAGETVSADLSGLDTDTTNASAALASDGTLTITDSEGGTVSADLSGLDTDTTNASAALSGTTLTITDSEGGTVSADLADLSGASLQTGPVTVDAVTGTLTPSSTATADGPLVDDLEDLVLIDVQYTRGVANQRMGHVVPKTLLAGATQAAPYRLHLQGSGTDRVDLYANGTGSTARIRSASTATTSTVGISTFQPWTFYNILSAKGDKGDPGDSGDENVQADWEETDSTSDAFILGKPTIPTVTGLSLTGTTLTLTDSASNTRSVDLAALRTINTNTFLESASLSASNVLTLTLSDNTSITVDLSDLEDTLTDTNTTVTGLALDNSNVLTLTDSAGNTVNVDLSDIAGGSGGGSADLSDYEVDALAFFIPTSSFNRNQFNALQVGGNLTITNAIGQSPQEVGIRSISVSSGVATLYIETGATIQGGYRVQNGSNLITILRPTAEDAPGDIDGAQDWHLETGVAAAGELIFNELNRIEDSIPPAVNAPATWAESGNTDLIPDSKFPEINADNINVRVLTAYISSGRRTAFATVSVGDTLTYSDNQQGDNGTDYEVLYIDITSVATPVLDAAFVPANNTYLTNEADTWIWGRLTPAQSAASDVNQVGEWHQSEAQNFAGLAYAEAIEEVELPPTWYTIRSVTLGDIYSSITLPNDVIIPLLSFAINIPDSGMIRITAYRGSAPIHESLTIPASLLRSGTAPVIGIVFDGLLRRTQARFTRRARTYGVDAANRLRIGRVGYNFALTETYVVEHLDNGFLAAGSLSEETEPAPTPPADNLVHFGSIRSNRGGASIDFDADDISTISRDDFINLQTTFEVTGIPAGEEHRLYWALTDDPEDSRDFYLGPGESRPLTQTMRRTTQTLGGIDYVLYIMTAANAVGPMFNGEEIFAGGDS